MPSAWAVDLIAVCPIAMKNHCGDKIPVRITHWLTFFAVEILWMEIFSRRNLKRCTDDSPENSRHAQAQNFFNGANFPLASAALYSDVLAR
jgi:hypothetical protein